MARDRTNSPIRLEWDEDGLHLELELDEINAVTIELGTDVPTLRGRLDTSQAWDLYEHVRDQLADWHAEGVQQRDNVRAGLDHTGIPYSDVQLVSRDVLDGLYADRAELLLERADIERKRAKGE